MLPKLSLLLPLLSVLACESEPPPPMSDDCESCDLRLPKTSDSEPFALVCELGVAPNLRCELEGFPRAHQLDIIVEFRFSQLPDDTLKMRLNTGNHFTVETSLLDPSYKWGSKIKAAMTAEWAVIDRSKKSLAITADFELCADSCEARIELNAFDRKIFVGPYRDPAVDHAELSIQFENESYSLWPGESASAGTYHEYYLPVIGDPAHVTNLVLGENSFPITEPGTYWLENGELDKLSEGDDW